VNRVTDLTSTILFFFICLFLYTKFAGPVPFSVNSIQTTKNTLFSATGQGSATAVPDTADISFGITKQAPTVADAQNSANSVVNQIVRDLTNLGIQQKDIKTTNYSVSPNYLVGQTVNGYTVQEQVELKVKPIEKANQVVDIATKDGANLVGGVNFVLDDATQKNLEQQARIDAVKQAKDKAESLANAAGIRLGRIVDVQESGNPQPIRFQAQAAPSADNTKTELNPGENTVTVSVTLSYETL